MFRGQQWEKCLCSHRLGNEAFRGKEYERAISLFSKAIDHVKDSPVLYNNRALSYIKLGLFKKAIIDADFVIQKLDEKNVRAWLYRANGFLLLGEQRNFEKSVNEAKKNNPKELDFIEKSVTKFIEDAKSVQNWNVFNVGNTKIFNCQNVKNEKKKMK